MRQRNALPLKMPADILPFKKWLLKIAFITNLCIKILQYKLRVTYYCHAWYTNLQCLLALDFTLYYFISIFQTLKVRTIMRGDAPTV